MDKPVYAAEGLYRVDTFTDTKIADLRMLVPVTNDGEPDATRVPRFFSQAQAKVNGQPFPVNFEIHAASLKEACDKLVDEAEKHTAHFIEKIQQQRAQPSLVVPPGIVRPSVQ